MKLTTLDVFNSNALKYEGKFMHLDLYNATYDAFLQNLKRGSSLLEVGCGPGNITRYFLDNRPDLKVLATDFSPNMIELAAKNLPEAEVQLLDAKEIRSLERNFDAIVCGFIAPYFSKDELQKLISDSANTLNNGGSFYISCIKGEHGNSKWIDSSDGKVSAFVQYYEAEDVSELLSEAGFSECSKFEIPYEKDTHLVFIANR